MIVPNAPCGVESLPYSSNHAGNSSGFLMHRVELKAVSSIFSSNQIYVPNAPCGVESHISHLLLSFLCWVPNAPCGVERKLSH